MLERLASDDRGGVEDELRFSTKSGTDDVEDVDGPACGTSSAGAGGVCLSVSGAATGGTEGVGCTGLGTLAATGFDIATWAENAL